MILEVNHVKVPLYNIHLFKNYKFVVSMKKQNK